MFKGVKEVTKQNKNKTKILYDYDPFSKLQPNNRRYINDESDDDESDDEFTYYCDYGEHFITFEEKQIKVRYEIISPNFPLCDKIDVKKKLTISCNFDKNYQSNLNTLQKLLKYHSEHKLKTLKKSIKIYISCDDFWRFYAKIPKRDMDTLYLENKKEIIKDIDFFLKSKHLFKNEGRPYKRNYLLYGPPGTGKTSLIIGLASIFERNIYKINLTNHLDDSILMGAISKIPTNGILVFEDIDNLFLNGESSTFNKTCITFGSFLNILDGFISKTNLITIMTTNLPIDTLKDNNSAFLRPGRIDKLVEFNYCNSKQINLICSHYIKKEEIKNDFISKISKIKTTSAALTKFLFENIMIQEIENINDDEYVENYKILTTQYNITNIMYN